MASLCLGNTHCGGRAQHQRGERPPQSVCSSSVLTGAKLLKGRKNGCSYAAARPLRSERKALHLARGSSGFADESHRSYYQASAPLTELSHKKATKLAKKLRKQRESLFKLAATVPMNEEAVNGMVGELDRVYADVMARANELRDSSSSSSSSEGEEVRARLAVDSGRDCSVAEPAGHVDDTDASVIVDQFRAQQRAASEASTSGGRFGAVCAMSVEERVRGPPSKVFVCEGKCCTRKGAAAVRAAAERSDWVTSGDAMVVSTGCLGKCKKGVAVRIKAGAGRPELVTRIDESQVDEVLEFKLNNSAFQVAVPAL